jgi:phage shock protein PspC (stress-responsive transcriptional regulator)
MEVTMKEKLFRSSQNKIIGGVCGGLGEYFQIDPIFVRIFFMLWVVVGEWGVLAYFLLWLIIPPQQYAGGSFQHNDLGARFRLIGDDLRDLFQNPSSQLLTYGGIALIGVGAVTLARALGWDWTKYWNSTLIWAGLLIIGGVFVLVKTYLKKK